MNCCRHFILGGSLMLACLAMPGVTRQSVAADEAPSPAAKSYDERLEAAEKYVEASEKYLHHSKLRRGMTGYGVTVMAGMERVRFEVEIVSVMTNWGPHQDAILARLSGLDLENTSIIAGMSGSPCYVEYEGKERLIGAVAYGWQAQKGSLCGIQPITQMLAAAGIGREAEGQKKEDAAPARAAASGRSADPKALLAAAMSPEKRDFSKLLLSRRDAMGKAAVLRPLTTPLMVSGLSARAMGAMDETFGPLGLMPVQAGGVGDAMLDGQDENLELVPGGAISIQLATGDADFNAVGTVTDVVDGRVLAFGHSFMAMEDLELPMGPAYVHTVIASLLRSSKLASGLAPTGTLHRDEEVGIIGRVGEPPAMVPMTVEITWPAGSTGPASVQRFSYQLAQHPLWTPVLASLLSQDAAWGWHDAPELHTVRHSVAVDFGDHGRYTAANVSSDRGPSSAISDLTRPLALMMNSSLGAPAKVRSIALKMEVLRGDTEAGILQLRLDGRVYRPGETVTGRLTVRPFRKDKLDLPVSFALPEDLPEGDYTLTACDSMTALGNLRNEKPQLFDPKTVAEALQAVQRIADVQDDLIYLRLPLPGEGLAIGKKELPDLPSSRAAVLSQAGLPDTQPYTRSLVRTMASQYVLSGSAQAKFEVQTTPSEIITRQIKE